MKKQMWHEKKDCGGEYLVEYTDESIPFLTCQKCGHVVEDWIKWNNEYSQYWTYEAKWKNKRDHLVCLLGFFRWEYRRHYGTDFIFSLNERGLFRGSEANHIRKLLGSFGGDAEVAKNYIGWVFEKKVAEKKRRITSLGFLNVAAVLNEFMQAREKNKLVGRSTLLPAGMLKWISGNAPELNEQVALKDFGDLRTLLKHVSKGSMAVTPEIQKFVEKLQKSGMVTDGLEITRWSE